MKRSIDEITQAPSSDLSKTERRRLAKQRKKEKNNKGGGGGVEGGKEAKKSNASSGAPASKGKKSPKPKMTKEERREKYTQKAYEAREKQNQAAAGANKTRCLGCRAWGHVVANCPDAKANTGICFNCGSNKHALRVCPKPKQADGSLPHATCFVCKAKGHISAQCKQNANGIYPKGGFCKECGSKHHLFWECPDRPESEKQKDKKRKTAVEASRVDASSDEDEKSASMVDAVSPAKTKRGGKNGLATEARTVVAAAAAAREKVTGEVGSKAKGEKADGSLGQSGKGGTKAQLARLPGGDDLEDDDYFEPEDVPALPGADDDDVEDGGEDRGAVGLAMKRSKGSGKKSKVVVF